MIFVFKIFINSWIGIWFFGNHQPYVLKSDFLGCCLLVLLAWSSWPPLVLRIPSSSRLLFLCLVTGTSFALLMFLMRKISSTLVFPRSGIVEVRLRVKAGSFSLFLIFFRKYIFQLEIAFMVTKNQLVERDSDFCQTPKSSSVGAGSGLLLDGEVSCYYIAVCLGSTFLALF